MDTKKMQMVINYVPGEECRVAIVEGGRLEEFHAERMDGPSSHVGNIYVGKVINVEPAIQAAFIDFGLEQNGFLHISDVHPQYFPGEDSESTERVGKKTPRRDRPPIQECFRRGDEVAVQVLKEGVGTKGPTVTSYLSIPGRFLVMMPQMDKVGVSRKVEDEEQRRKMRDILDQLDLPEGFGFILRTAGMERTKAELKRDLAYLQRLWKDMEKRWRGGSKPRLLYSESDLLVRALRDILTSEIEEVVVDNPAALSRAARFLKIVAPRTTTRIVHFTGKAPVFHVMGIEPQIQMIHAREVPLESGGRLVIDEAEALVAIDVNSGRSRDARDAETNAYRTNMEACDEICRQLRLRDIGGVIVNDLIDMRSAKHRRDVETRFRELLKKDRARWTIAPISEFGILEMTRQRMRGSHESQHFADCPTCRGRGLVQRPDSVAADGLRELAALLDSERVHRIEMVVHPRIAGELLSNQRRALTRLERESGKHVDVRVSEPVAVDRLTFYAYDDRGADIDLATLTTPTPRPEEFQQYAIEHDDAENWAEEPVAVEVAEPEPIEATEDVELHPIEIEPEFPGAGLESTGAAEQMPSGDQELGADGQPRRRRRRRGRRGRGMGNMAGPNGPVSPENGAPHVGEAAHDGNGAYAEEGYAPQQADGYAEAPLHLDPNDPSAGGSGPDGRDPNGPPGTGHEGGEGGPRRRRRRGRRGRGGSGGAGVGGAPGAPMTGAPHADSHGPGPSGMQSDSYASRFQNEASAYDQSAPSADGAGGNEQPYQEPVAGDEQYTEHTGGEPPLGDQPPFVPGGQPGEGDPQGPRRRRRRRGGRGRGGAGGVGGGGGGAGQPGFPNDPAMNGHAPDGGAPYGSGPQQGEYAPANGEAGYAPEHANHGDHADHGGEQGPDGAMGSDGQQGPGALGGPGGGRRRRRRRGRGGRGGGDGAGQGGPQAGSSDMPGSSHGQGQGGHGHASSRGGPPHGPDSSNGARGGSQRGPRDQHSGGQGPRDGGSGQGQSRLPQQPQSNRPGSRPAQPSSSSSPPRSSPAPQAGAGAPKPRTLYSSRRRLGPGDIKGLKREE